MTYLDLSRNDITVLENGAFSDLGNLDKLDLRNNELSVIKMDFFTGKSL